MHIPRKWLVWWFRKRYRAAAVSVLSVAILSSACGSSASAASKATPLAGKTLTIIVPNAPGGPMDSYARMTVPYLKKSLGASAVKVDDVTGAAGVIGINQLNSSSPNGLNVGFTDASEILLPSLGGSPGVHYNPAKLTYLGAISSAPYILVVGMHSGISSIATLRSSHGIFKYPTSGLGPDFYSIAGIAKTLGFGLSYISGYSSLAETTRAVLAGSVSGELLQESVAAPYIKAGEVRPILAVSSQRLAQYPSLPLWSTIAPAKDRAIADTFTEILTIGRTFYGPPGMKPTVSTMIEHAVVAMLHNKTFQAAAAKAKLPLVYRSGTQEATVVKAMIQHRAEILPLMKAAKGKIA